MGKFKLNDKIMCIKGFDTENAPKEFDVFTAESIYKKDGKYYVKLDEVFNIYEKHTKEDAWSAKHFVKISEIQYNKKKKTSDLDNFMENLMD